MAIVMYLPVDRLVCLRPGQPIVDVVLLRRWPLVEQLHPIDEVGLVSPTVQVVSNTRAPDIYPRRPSLWGYTDLKGPCRAAIVLALVSHEMSRREAIASVQKRTYSSSQARDLTPSSWNHTLFRNLKAKCMDQALGL